MQDFGDQGFRSDAPAKLPEPGGIGLIEGFGKQACFLCRAMILPHDSIGIGIMNENRHCAQWGKVFENWDYCAGGGVKTDSGYLKILRLI